DEAIDYGEQAIALARARGDPRWEALALANTAIARVLTGEDDEATRAQVDAENALEIASELDGKLAKAAVFSLAGFVVGQVQPERALALFRQSIDVWEEMGARSPGIWAIAADIASRKRDPCDALDFYARSIDELLWYGYRPVLASSLSRTGTLLASYDPEA